jgi:hypothetical protein
MVTMETSFEFIWANAKRRSEMIFGPAITNSRSSNNLPVADCAVL